MPWLLVAGTTLLALDSSEVEVDDSVAALIGLLGLWHQTAKEEELLRCRIRYRRQALDAKLDANIVCPPIG